jgi:photosystem II stability/assembly factor-like uncharacterized protein
MRALLPSLAMVLLCSLAASQLQGQAYWVPVSSPTTSHLNAVAFTDSLYGWIVGNSGTLLKTTDGGLTWAALNPEITNDIVDVQMANRLEGWALAHEITGSAVWTRILFTTDGGTSWRNESYPLPDVVLNSVSFSDPQTGWVAGEASTLAGTTDGGHTWKNAVLDSGVAPVGDLRRLRFLNPLYGYAVGGRFDLTGVVWRTSNGGETWSATLAAPEPINDMHFIDSMNVIGVTGDYDYGSGIVRTTDGGAHWQYTYLGIWGDARGLAFRTPSEGWAVLGFAGTCMVTRDTGLTWQSMFTPETTSVSDIQFVTDRCGIMVGAEGKIFRFDPDVVSVPASDIVPSRTHLLSPYPNPFNPAAVLGFEIGTRAHVLLSVCDITGREVATLIDGIRDAGTHQAVFDAGNLASGMYFCRLQVFDESSRFSAAAKLLLMR